MGYHIDKVNPIQEADVSHPKQKLMVSRALSGLKSHSTKTAVILSMAG